MPLILNSKSLYWDKVMINGNILRILIIVAPPAILTITMGRTQQINVDVDAQNVIVSIKLYIFIIIISRDGWIRTNDPFVPNEVFYRTELHLVLK